MYSHDDKTNKKSVQGKMRRYRNSVQQDVPASATVEFLEDLFIGFVDSGDYEIAGSILRGMQTMERMRAIGDNLILFDIVKVPACGEPRRRFYDVTALPGQSGAVEVGEIYFRANEVHRFYLWFYLPQLYVSLANAC
jgi:hypothetical protein